MKTRINMQTATYERICLGANQLGISRSQLIRLLVMHFEKNIHKKLSSFKTVKYQQSSSDAEWKMFHIDLSPAEYECFTDLRNHCKMSVSLIVATAVMEFLDMIVDYTLPMDNYPFILFPVYAIYYSITKNNYTITVQNHLNDIVAPET